MLWSLVRLSTGAQRRGYYTDSLQVTSQSAVAGSQTEDSGLFTSIQQVDWILTGVVTSSFLAEDCLSPVADQGFYFLVCQAGVWLLFLAAFLCQSICCLISGDSGVGRDPLQDNGC